jgi:hypothetical protein
MSKFNETFSEYITWLILYTEGKFEFWVQILEPELEMLLVHKPYIEFQWNAVVADA